MPATTVLTRLVANEFIYQYPDYSYPAINSVPRIIDTSGHIGWSYLKIDSDGNATVGRALTVNNDATLSRNVQVTGTMNVGGASTLDTLQVTKTLGVTGLSTLNSLQVNTTMNVSGDSTFADNIAICSDNYARIRFQNLNKTTTFGGVISNADGTKIGVGADFAGLPAIRIDTSGNTTLTGDASVTKVLTVGGSTTLSNTLSVAGTATMLSNLVAGSDVTVAGALGVTGATTLRSRLDVTGASTVHTLDVSGYMGVTGAVTLRSTLDVTGNTSIVGTLGVTGMISGRGGGTFTGTLKLGSSDVVTTVTGGGGITAVKSGNAYTITNTGVSTLTSGTGISVTGSGGALTITNSGVTQVTAGTGMSVNANTGSVTISNAGVTQLTAPYPGLTVSAFTGNITLTNTGVTQLTAGKGMVVDRTTGAITVTADPDLSVASSSASWGANGHVGTFGSGTSGVVMRYNVVYNGFYKFIGMCTNNSARRAWADIFIAGSTFYAVSKGGGEGTTEPGISLNGSELVIDLYVNQQASIDYYNFKLLLISKL